MRCGVCVLCVVLRAVVVEEKEEEAVIIILGDLPCRLLFVPSFSSGSFLCLRFYGGGGGLTLQTASHILVLGCLTAILGPFWGHLGTLLSRLGPPGDDPGLSMFFSSNLALCKTHTAQAVMIWQEIFRT